MGEKYGGNADWSLAVADPSFPMSRRGHSRQDDIWDCQNQHKYLKDDIWDCQNQPKYLKEETFFLRGHYSAQHLSVAEMDGVSPNYSQKVWTASCLESDN